MELSFVIVNHKSDFYLSKCIASLKAANFTFSHEIIVIHNDDSSALDRNLLFSFPEVKIFSTGANVGFAKANNFGATFCRGKNFCFLNPDTEFFTCDLQPLLNKLSSHEIVSPQLVIDLRLTPQKWSAGSEITLFSILKNNIGLNKDALLWKASQPIEVDWVSGACLFITKKLFQELNGFDENFFMYFEDVDLCKRARKLKKKILLFPNIKILHWGGRSRKNAFLQKKMYYISQDYYFKKHFSPLSGLALKLIRTIFQKKA